MMGEDPIER
jgi:hypothetical protein